MGNATPSGDLPTAVRQAMRLLGGGDLVSAEAQALEILRAVPGEPNAEFILAAIRRTRGDAEGARQALTILLRQAPAFALATQELGFALLDLGLIEEAVTALHDAVKTEPALAPSWKALAEIEGARGNAELAAEAASRFALARATDPRLVEATELFRKGNTPAAERACRAYLHDQPTDVSAIRLLADIGTRLGMLQDAENLLARCLELAPDFTLARLNYAQVLSKRENLPAALAQVDLLLAAEPNRFPFLVLRASILVKMGEFEKGIRAYEQLTDTFGPRPMVTLVHGHALKTVGRQEEAIAAYRKTIELNPCFGDAYWSLANLKTFRFEDADISAMRSQLASDQPSLEDHFHLCFALGKALEDRGEFEESFACYQRGNAIKSRLEKHDEAELAREVERNIVVCTRQFFESRRGSGCPAPDPIFIVGLPRSGSTLLEQILASHSKVDGTKELIDIPAIVRRLGGRRRKGEPSRYPDILGSLDAGQLLQLGEEYLERARVQRGSAPHFIDKMPNNFRHIGLLQLILPNARIIDARRHPMAACFSGFKQLFAQGQSFTYGLGKIARYYREYVKLMDHWDQALPGKVLRVEYETVIDDTEGQVKRILDFCGLAFEESCLDFHRTERAVRTASSEQVRQPIYREGLDQWRHYEPWLAELKSELGTVLERYPA